MNVKNITERVTYCGVNDRTTSMFENIWDLPYGVSYNSYIVRGSEMSALIDGSEAGHANEFVGHVLEALDGGHPDYLIINHIEPDHSGAVPMLKKMFPAMKIVGNAKTIDMLKGFYAVKSGITEVRDGDTLSLGDRTLRFLTTPMVHWPETMMTYLEEDGVLFTGDAFGCFGALDGAVVDDDMDARRFFPEAYRYYGCIIAKYGQFVAKAIEKTAPLTINHICTTHGPVWHSLREEIVGLYSRMAGWEAEAGVVIAYGSMYGNTATLAEALAGRLAAEGVREIRVHDVSHSPLSRILADVMRFRGLALVSPTYNTEIFPPVAALARSLIDRGIRNRLVGIMGSYAWGGQAVRKLTAMFDGSDVTILAPSPQMKQSLIGAVEPDVARLAREMAAGLSAG